MGHSSLHFALAWPDVAGVFVAIASGVVGTSGASASAIAAGDDSVSAIAAGDDCASASANATDYTRATAVAFIKQADDDIAACDVGAIAHDNFRGICTDCPPTAFIRSIHTARERGGPHQDAVRFLEVLQHDSGNERGESAGFAEHDG